MLVATTLVAAVLASSGCDGADGADGTFPEGAWRAERPEDAFVAAGLSDDVTANHAGVWTISFEDGRLEVHDVNDASGDSTTQAGVYCVDGDQIAVGFTECGDFWTARWVSVGDELHFEELEAGYAHDRPGEELLLTTIFGSDGWTVVR
jgi:hypothetical protein